MSQECEPSPEVREELIAVEDRRRQALVTADVDALAELFDEDLLHIHAPGVVHTKAQLLEHVGTRQAYISIERGPLNIRLAGDAAVMTGSVTNRLRNPDGSERTVEGVITQVLRRGVDGVWRFVSFQMTPLGKQVWGALQ